ncbi:serum paraoxonase/arylesterase 2-like [Antedon mediterranea]|uniref:serum paraoxonase/arylesterase 2-like n=1 Tax=Antedon mediterranea TaxID=105859 RepID=UPI003AF8AC3C
MTPMLKCILFAGLVLLVQRIMYVVVGFGFHKTLFDHAPGPCRKLPPIEYGSEDITTLPSGIAIISSGLYGPPTSNLYTYNFNNPDKGVQEVKLVNFKRSNLYPHGMSTWIDPKSGKVTLFLVNHSPDREAVVIFDFNEAENTLSYKKTITDTLFTSLNDVVATGPDTFYATNFLLFGYKYMLLDKILRLSFASVVFYDGEKASFVATGLSGANGINISPDKRTVYVATTFSHQVRVYSRKTDSSLEPVKILNIYTAPDNIEVDPTTGDLLVGCHPLVHKLLSSKERIKGASQILHIHFDGDWNETIREVYADNGNNFKGSSVASFYGNQMLVGSITGHLLRCDVRGF